MAFAVMMPRQGQSVESCILTEWHKNVGDAVSEGDILFTYETDKATFEETAKEGGILLARFFEVDDDVPCLLNVAVIGEAGEDILAFSPEGAAAPEKAPAAAPAAATPAAEHTLSAIPAGEKPESEAARAISPRAKSTAERLHVDASLATPTGPHGRVIERDIAALMQAGVRSTPAAHQAGVHGSHGTGIGGRMQLEDAQKAAALQVDAPVSLPAPGILPSLEYEEVKLSNMRRVIARGMLTSLQTTAQLTNHGAFDASAILKLRAELKAAPERMDLPNITLNDILLFACSRVLLRHGDLNAHLVDEKIRRYKHVHLGMAVDTQRGLLVPTIFNADTMSLREIAAQAKTLAASAQSGNISPDLLTGATFTISNLGGLGVEQFTPVINPPQTGILGVGGIVERIRTKDGAIGAYPAMLLSLTYDHRVVDGAPAARFVQDLKQALENITCMLA